MRIGIFSECYKPTMNGVVISIETFKKSLEKKGHEFFIFAPKTKKYIDQEKDIFRIPSFAWPGQNYYPIALPIFAPWVLEKAIELELDLIHCQHLFNMGGLGLSVGHKLQIPVVYTYHTLIAEYNQYFPLAESITKKYLIKKSKNFCNLCDQIVAPSQSMKKVLYRYGVRKPIEVIPTGIEPKKFKRYDSRLLKAKYDIADNEKLLLFVGRLAEEKNLSFLLKAFRLIRKKHHARLIIVGGGPQEAEYKKLCFDLGISEWVIFTGFLDKDETEKIFGSSDIFVFPSITDTQGIVITEAMAAGTPPVAVAKMGPKDIINTGKDGLLTDLTLDDFSGKIGYLLRNPEVLKKMSIEAKKTAIKYSNEVSANKMEKLYFQTQKRKNYGYQTSQLHSRPSTETDI